MNSSSGDRKANRGRPRLPREELRSERIVTFLTKDEYQTFSKFAALVDQSISSAAHDLIVDSPQFCKEKQANDES